MIVTGTPSVAAGCAYYAANSDTTKKTGNGVRFAGGVDLGTSIGIDVSAQTNWTSTAKLFIDFTTKAKLCGTKGSPGSTNAGSLVVLNQ